MIQNKNSELYTNFSQQIFQSQNLQFKSTQLPDQNTIHSIQNIFSLLQNSKQNENDVLQISEKDDIIKGIYEGGFKLWECTIDLLNYISSNNLNFDNKFVIDLGCGHGLLGIYAYLKQSKQVVFQDFNLHVLKYCTLINLMYNSLQLQNDVVQSLQTNQVVLLDGDWKDTFNKLQSNQNDAQKIEKNLVCQSNQINQESKFDVILMSEVIYNEDNYVKILDLLEQILSEKGICLLATKMYYYGVGGSSNDFLEVLEQKYPQFLGDIVWQSDSKRQTNKRQIIQIQKKN